MSKRSCEAAESIEDAVHDNRMFAKRTFYCITNGACERTANAKTLRKDRTASEWKDVAFATRRRRIYPMRNVVVYYTKV